MPIVQPIEVMAGAYILGVLFSLAVGMRAWAGDPPEAATITALLAKPHLAQWKCSADEQRRFRQQQSARLRRMLARRLLLSLAACGAVIVFLLVVTRITGGEFDSLSVLTALAVGALVGGMYAGLAPQSNSRLNPRRLFARRGSAPAGADGLVALDRKAVYVFGEYFTLRGESVSTASVALQPGDPASLVFETHTQGPRRAVTKEHIYVPVAAGAQAQAAALAQQFSP